MTWCTLCVVWFHDICVGLGKDESIGIWLYPTCRNIPQTVQNEVINIIHIVTFLSFVFLSVTSNNCDMESAYILEIARATEIQLSQNHLRIPTCR